jgi:hypothetical protein
MAIASPSQLALLIWLPQGNCLCRKEKSKPSYRWNFEGVKMQEQRKRLEDLRDRISHVMVRL